MQLSDHPHWTTVQKIYHTLVDHGYKAYLAGGCVRDFLLGRTANDLDIATNATPDQVEGLFGKTVAVGKAFGVILVVEDGITFEIATFRSDGAYVNGRHPESIVFTSPEEDAKRRDFTVNALFYDLHEGRVLDFVGGIKDLNAKTLRAVGSPSERFQEDHLRLVRAVRFSAQLDFEIESGTLASVKSLSSLVKSVSPERIHEEIFKLLKSAQPLRGLSLLDSTGIGKALFPGWSSIYTKSSGKEFALLFSAPVAEGEDAEGLLWIQFLAPWALQKEIGWTRILEQYRFSRQLNKNLRKALERLENTAHFFMTSKGEQRALLADPSVQLFLHVCEKLGIQTHHVEALKQKWRAWNFKMPEAWVKAEDISHLAQGREMGAILHRCYVLQLEEQFKDKNEVLAQGLKILKT